MAFYKYVNGSWQKASCGAIYLNTYHIPSNVALCQKMTGATELYSAEDYNPSEEDVQPIDGEKHHWAQYTLDRRLAKRAEPPKTKIVYRDADEGLLQAIAGVFILIITLGFISAIFAKD